MIRFKRLTKEELKLLQHEFIQFLIAQGIDSGEWVRIKKVLPEKSKLLVDQFSNLVLEKALKNVQYLEYHSPKKIASIHCGEDMMRLAVIEVTENSDVDLTDNKYIQLLIKTPKNKVKIYQSEKAYRINREEEVFSYTEKGWMVSDGKLFNSVLTANT